MSKRPFHNKIRKSDVGVFSVVFMIFSICAAGAYGIEAMIPEAGPGLTLVMLVVFPFVWGLPIVLASVELGAARPVEGGFYRWVQEGLGEFWGFQAGWWKTIANYLDSTVYIILAGGYMGYITGMTDQERYVFQLVIIAVILSINLRGVRYSGRSSILFGIIILLMFALVTAVGFMNVRYDPFDPFIPESQSLLTSIGGGIALSIWLYSGYEAVSVISGELKDPGVIQKATLTALPLISLTYILPTAAGLSSVGQWQHWQEGITEDTVGFGTVLSEFLGHGYWGAAFGVVAVISACSMYNTCMMSGSRILFTLAEDNLGPRYIMKINRHGVPYAPALLMAAVNVILCSFDFSVVMIIEVLLIIGTYILIFITMIAMRIRKPDMHRPVRIKGPSCFIYAFFTIPVLVGILAYLLNGTDYFIGGLIGILSGPVAYVYFKKRYRGLHRVDRKLYPDNRKTKLAPGDLYRISMMFIILAVLAVEGALFLPWYEGGWGREYYMETYGADIFHLMLDGLWVIAVLNAVTAAVLFRRGRRLERPQYRSDRKNRQ